MKLRKTVSAMLLISVLLTAIGGCSEVEYDYTDSSSSAAGQSSREESSAPPANIRTETAVTEYKINKAAFDFSAEAETLTDGEPLTEADGYSGDGYISLGDYSEISLTVDFVSSQFYDIQISACSAEGGSVSLIIDGTKQENSENGEYKRTNGILYGAYRIPQSDKFDKYSVCPIYLEQGKHKITLQSTGADVSIDLITAGNTAAVSNDRYTKAVNSISGKDINDGRKAVMDYFKSIYGSKTLLAQYVTPNTNAELDIISRNTDRYPAVRCSDLMYYTAAGSKLSKTESNDIQLALQWAEDGGLVSYSWYWYSPIGKTTFFSDECEMKVSDAVSNKKDIAVLTNEELSLLLENESISEECYALLSDMDGIAKQLTALKNKDIPVLFRPLPCSEDGRYWWEQDAETYRWLWKTMHRRFDELYGLSNIIWVCSVTDEQMFPGEEYIDIIGSDFYNRSNTSNLWAMLKTDKLALSCRMTALTECAFTPDPDLMYRDKAMWLWTAPWNGSYLINENGSLNGEYISVNQLKKVYNHELTITRDELRIKELLQ